MPVREVPVSMEVPVRGGVLGAAHSGPPPREAEGVVLLVHGVTANAAVWRLVDARLPECVAGIAVDLRGRADSADLPGPWGMRVHAADLVSVLDHVGIEEAVVVGHSMGAFVTTTFAELHADRVRAAVLVDGGVPLPRPQDADPRSSLDQLLGPAIARLRTTFRSRAECHAFWKAHPAFKGCWNTAVEAFADHDLGGSEPRLRSRALEEAVRFDGAELLLDEAISSAIERIACPTELLRVERGITNQAEPLVPLDAAMRVAEVNPHVSVTTVPNLNHYTVTLSPTGADAVAAAIGRALAR